MPSYPEGAIADGPNGAIVYRGGQWVPLNSAPTVVQAPYNPAAAYELPKAAAGLQSTQANTQGQYIDNRIKEATAGATIAQEQGQAEKMQLEIEKLRRELAQGPQINPQQAELRDRISRLNQLTAQLDRVQELYDAGPGKTSGIGGIADYLPSDANAAFDAAGAALSQQGLAAFRVPGTGTVSDRDAMMFDRANLPEASTRDTAIEEQLRGLRSRVNEEMQSLGRAAPFDAQGKRIVQRSPLTDTYLDNSGEQTRSAGFAATTETKPVPRAMQDEYNAYMQRWTANPDVGDYVRFRQQLDTKYGFGWTPETAADNQARADIFAQSIRAGKGSTIPLTIPGIEQPMNADKIVGNSLFNALTVPMNAIDAAAMGAPSAVIGQLSERAGQDFAANNEENWKSALAGQVGGAIAGTKGLSFAGGKLAGQLGRAGEILRNGGGATGQIARNIGADATYGGMYAGTQGGDPLTGAALGAAGSLVGQGGVGIAGGAMRGVGSATARGLSEAGISLTPGQIVRGKGVLGQMAGGMEDRLSGFSGIGDLIGSARRAGVEDWNRLDMQRAVEDIGGNVTKPGTGGYAQADAALSRQYDRALEPMRLNVDGEMQSALERLRGYAPMVNDNVTDGIMTGRGFQAAKQLMEQEAANLRTTPGGFTSLPKVQGLKDALFQMGERQAPDLVEKYRMADAAAAALASIKKATAGAVNSGGVYTPAQKGTAFRTTDRSAGRRATALGRRPGFDFQQAAQQVLPSSVPDSGTAGRAILGGLAVGGGAAGAQNWVDPSVALPIAALAALYTKTGQKAFQNLLVKRTGAVGTASRSAGLTVKRLNRKGLFGTATSAIDRNLREGN
jgi:hypothetical protein